MTSLTKMACWVVRGWLAPAALMALTLTWIFTPVGRPVTVYLVFSVSPGLAVIHSSAEKSQSS